MINDYSKLKRYNSFADAKIAYFKELEEHHRLVNEAFEKYGKLITDKLGVDIDKLASLIIIHDKSKREINIEIEGFMANYFPYEGDGIADDAYGLRRAIYEKGLLSHFHNNPHHPEFWVFIRAGDWKMDAKPMDPIYICEMILDWIAYQNKFKLRTIKEYWDINYSTKYIHPDTTKLIDILVNLITEEDKKEKEAAGE